ncbi:MAG: ZIP family metal transporter [Bacilli bacterium]|nr:ZIP family metal transporter [Bacilli bacterium]MDD3895484.1 ZIP family metal transporter [Bacilli bacterium]MDD4407427.1 ZIP family metal transporter [Bacilli bacterium]
MEILIALTISLVAGLSTVLGALFIFYKPINKYNFIGSCLAFSATIMLLISVTELIPKGFIYIKYKHSFILAMFILIIMLFIGNLISSTLNKKINKIAQNSNNLYRVGILSMIVLIIHNFPEGILTFLGSMIDINFGLSIATSIMLHNIPEGIAIAIPIYYATKSRRKAIKNVFLSGLSEPIGALLAWIFLYRYLNNFIISIILLFVAALMISIAINDIFEEANKYSRKSVLIGIFLACIFFTINSLILN